MYLFKNGPKPTFGPGSNAALRLPENGHSCIEQHSRLVKVSRTDQTDLCSRWANVGTANRSPKGLSFSSLLHPRRHIAFAACQAKRCCGLVHEKRGYSKSRRVDFQFKIFMVYDGEPVLSVDH